MTWRVIAALAAKFLFILLTLSLAAVGCEADQLAEGPSPDASVTPDASVGPKLPSSCKVNNDCNGNGISPVCQTAYSCIQQQCVLIPGGPLLKKDGTPCSDESLCTTGDQCSSGACVGTPQICGDNNDCTSDSCDPASGCVNTAIQVVCDDGDDCTKGDSCKDGNCVSSSALDCNDENPCTTDSCDPTLGCVNTNNTLACTDGNACTQDDACKDGVCTSGTAVVCNDNNPCTNDTCAPATGCTFTAVADGKTCNDGDPSTKDDACTASVCVGEPAVFCATDDECLAWVNTTCGTVACVEGACILSSFDSFDDGNPCTTDGCSVEKGVFHTPLLGASCNDGNACTEEDVCSSIGTCKGAAKMCNDGDACTTDGCDSKTGCYALAQQMSDWIDKKWWTKDGCSSLSGPTHTPYYIYFLAFQSVNLDDFFAPYAEVKYAIKSGKDYGVTSMQAPGTLGVTALDICPSYLLTVENPVTFTGLSKSIIDNMLYVNGGEYVKVKKDDGQELTVTLLPPETMTPDAATIPPDGVSSQLRDYCLKLMSGN